MKRVALVAAMAFSVAAMIGVSLLAAQRERRDLDAQFRETEGRRAADAAEVLREKLGAAERDTQFLAHLTAETRHRPDLNRVAQDREIGAAYRALATSVAHYWSIAAFPEEELKGPAAPPVVALDPTEIDPGVVEGLISRSRELAAHIAATASHQFVLSRPLELGGRTFYLLGLADDGVTVVISLDAALLLAGVFPSPHGSPFYARVAVIDPSGVAWVNELDPRGLHHLRMQEDPWPLLAAVASSGTAPFRTDRRVELSLGAFRITTAAATDALLHRQRVVIGQLLLTTGGVIAALVFFGTLLLRQQGKAARLGERLAAAEEIAHLKERSDKILENAPLGIAGLTSDGRMVFMNRYLRQRAKTAGDSAAADERDARFVEPVWPAQVWLPALQPWVTRAVDLKSPLSLGAKDLPDLAGLFQEMEVQIVPLTHPIDDLEVLVLMRDVSEIRALERHLVRAEKLVTVGALSAGLAHDLGTPLMVVRGRAEGLREAATLPDERADLDAIITQIDRVSAIVRQVLGFARAEPLATTPVEAAAEARESARLIGWRGRNKKIAVQVVEAPGLRPLEAHQGQLQQVFVNLLSNACDASPEGAEVTVRLAPDPKKAGFMRLEVEDHGHGIPAELLHAVFDPYFTTKPQGEGAGLGLAVVAQIVRAHRGEISLVSAPGRGTTVIISWPFLA